MALVTETLLLLGALCQVMLVLVWGPALPVMLVYPWPVSWEWGLP